MSHAGNKSGRGAALRRRLPLAVGLLLCAMAARVPALERGDLAPDLAAPRLDGAGTLSLAAERGIAVIVNRPFQRGDLIHRLEGHPLPGWAGEIGCANWPQFLLKFIVSHPAVTCAIPATSQVEHIQENMGACYGALPDADMRARMIAYVENL